MSTTITYAELDESTRKTTATPTPTRTSLAELCFHLDPSQMATLCAWLERSAAFSTDQKTYQRMTPEIREEMDGNCGEEEADRYLASARRIEDREEPAPTARYQVLYEDPAEGWTPTNLGIFDDAEEAKEAARNWLNGYASRGQGETRTALQALKPAPLPEGATLIDTDETYPQHYGSRH
jgi:hypothetical protein